jgi:DNA-directed RNA polymerase II subunit RPB2
MSKKLAESFYSETWTVMDRYFEDTPYFVTRHHLESFNRFLHAGIRSAIGTMNPQLNMLKNDVVDGKPVKYEVQVHVGGKDASRLYLDQPTIIETVDGQPRTRPLYPNEARLKSMTYGSNLYADVLIEYMTDGRLAGTREFRVRVCRLPIMLHSAACVLNGCSPEVAREMGECPFDMGGYFIVEGLEKVIITQERTAYNTLFTKVMSDTGTNDVSVQGTFRSVNEKKSLFPWTTLIKVVSANIAAGKRKDAVVMSVPYITGDIPLLVLFRALGIESDKAILDIIAANAPDDKTAAKMRQFLRASILDAGGIYTQADAVHALTAATDYRTPERLKYILTDFFLNNTGDDDFGTKAVYLSHLVAGVIRVAMGQLPPSQQDQYSNKRLQLSGFLVTDMFRDMYLRFVRLAKMRLDQAYMYGPWKNSGNILNLVNASNLTHIFDGAMMESGILTSFKGRWNYDETALSPGDAAEHTEDGVIQDLNRFSYQLYLSYLRRIDIALDRSIKIVAPHLLLGSHWGAICPIESPDGPSIGLIKHIALLTHVTFPVDPAPLLGMLESEGLLQGLAPLAADPRRLVSRAVACKVFLNDNWVGVTADVVGLTRFLRALRRLGVLHPTTSIAPRYLHHEIRVSTTTGRLARPLYIVDRIPGQSEDHQADDQGETFGTSLAGGSNQLRITDAMLSQLRAGKRLWHQLISVSRPQDHSKTDDAMGSWPSGAVDAKAFADLRAKLLASASSNGNNNGKRLGTSLGDRLGDPGVLARVLPALAKMEEREAKVGAAAVIEYVDVDELESLLVATTAADLRDALKRYTHCELHPCTIFSMVSSLIPLLHHNNAAYNSLALAQTKQAIGVYVSNFAHRFDSAGLILHYPQLPFVTSSFAQKLCGGRLMHGENLIVAIMTYTGYNQEDAAILNADSAMRGMFNLSYYHTVRFDEDEYGDEALLLCNPLQMQESGTSVEGIRPMDFGHIDARGLPKEGTILREGAILCGRVHVKTERTSSASVDRIVRTVVKRRVYTDRSVVVERGQDGFVVDKVFVFRKPNGRACAKVRLRQVRTPALGDKVASRFAQKGVVGMLVRREDMPFTASGVVPDIIINPHAFPKRMTVGHLLDCILSKVCATSGARMCSNMFEPKDMAAIQGVLLDRYGLDKSGDEVMYNGFTGEQIQCSIFVGPNYYGRLKHMVADKINFRDTGPHNFMTRQPTKGRGKHGGLRVGEMEEHVILAHGMAAFMKESFMERSDGHVVTVDGDTGASASVLSNHIADVHTVLNTADVVNDMRTVQVPYAFKLMQQELQSMTVEMRMRFEGDDDDYQNDDDYRNIIDVDANDDDDDDDDADDDDANDDDDDVSQKQGMRSESESESESGSDESMTPKK